MHDVIINSNWGIRIDHLKQTVVKQRKAGEVEIVQPNVKGAKESWICLLPSLKRYAGNATREGVGGYL